MMLQANQKKAVAGLFAASLALAMAPMAGAPAHFTNDQGEMMWVDPPDPGRQPIFVALPVSGEQGKSPVRETEKHTPPGK
jgi:hypothetical protein